MSSLAVSSTTTPGLLYPIIGPQPTSDSPEATIVAEARAALTSERLALILDKLHTAMAHYAPDCFISYPWGEPYTEARVNRLASDLARAGIRVFYDRVHNAPGTSIPLFTQYIYTAQKVVFIATPLFLIKHTQKTGVLGTEETPKIIDRVTHGPLTPTQNSVIPALFEGSPEESIPEILRVGPNRLVFIDFRPHQSYEIALMNLLRSLYDTHTDSIFRDVHAKIQGELANKTAQDELLLQSTALESLPALIATVKSRVATHTNLKASLAIKEWRLPLKPSLLIRRAELLSELRLHFERKTDRRTSIAVLRGLGGVGKSSLALQHAHESLESYTMIAWFRADREAVLQDDWISLGTQLGIFADPKESIQAKIERMKMWFSHHDRWLVVFDNADDLSLLTSYLPNTGGDIIITSRNTPPLGWDAKIISMEGLNLPFAVQLLQNYVPDTINNVALEKIASKLEGLPLALAQAGAYMRKMGCSPEAYLDLLEKRASALFNTDFIGGGDPRKILSSTFSLHMEEINRTSRYSIILLQLCAYLDPDNIPISLFETYFNTYHPEVDGGSKSYNEVHVNNWIEPLVNDSLLNRRDTNTVQIHRLVQQIPQLKDESLINNLAKVVVSDYEKSYLESKQHQLIHHLEVLYQNQKVEPLTIARIGKHLAKFYAVSGKADKALAVLHRVLDIEKQIYGSEDCRVAVTLGNLGGVYWSLERLAHAETYLNQSLSILETYYNQGEGKIRENMEHLRNAYGLLGELRSAAELREQILVIKDDYYTEGTCDFRRSLMNMGVTPWAKPMVQKAHDLLNRALQIEKRLNISQNLAIGTLLLNLGEVSRLLNRRREAKKQYEKAYEIFKPTEHPQLIYVLTKLGNTYLETGNLEKCKQTYEEVLTIKERMYGQKHFQVAEPLIYLGLVHCARNEFELARNFLERARSIQESYYDQDHAYLCPVLELLGLIHQVANHLSIAEAFYQRVLRITEKNDQEKHFQTAGTLGNLAMIYVSSGRLEEARILLERIITIHKSYKGYSPEDPHIKKTLDLLKQLDQEIALPNKKRKSSQKK